MSGNRKVTEFFASSSSSAPSSSRSQGRRSASALPLRTPQKARTRLLSDKPSAPGTPIIELDTGIDNSIEIISVTTSKHARINTASAGTRQIPDIQATPPSSPATSPVREVFNISSGSSSPVEGRRNRPIELSSDTDGGPSSGYMATRLRTGLGSTSQPIVVTDSERASSSDEVIAITIPPSLSDMSKALSRTENESQNDSDEMDWVATPPPPTSQQRSLPFQPSPDKSHSFLPTPDHTSPETSMSDVVKASPERIVIEKPQSPQTPFVSHVPHTPPASVSPQSTAYSLLSRHVSPDRRESTARLIAQIKADAMKHAEALSSDVEDKVALDGDPTAYTSDDDDLDDLDLSLNKAKSSDSSFVREKLAPPKFAPLPSPHPDSEEDVAGTSSRASSADSLNVQPRRSTRPRKLVSHSSKSVPKPLTATARHKPTIFDDLIREDTRQRKKGAGLAAVDRVIAKGLDSESEDSMNTDEHRLSKSKLKRKTTPVERRGSRRGSVADEDDQSVERFGSDEDMHDSTDEYRHAAQKFLGPEGTERLHDIMKDEIVDTRHKAHANANEVQGRRRFWTERPQSKLSSFSAPNDALALALSQAIRDDRFMEATIIMSRWSTYPGRADPNTARQYISILLDAVLTSNDSNIGQAASQALTSFIEDSDELHLQDIVLACSRLGADAQSLALLQTVGDEKTLATTAIPDNGRVASHITSVLASLLSAGLTKPSETPVALLLMLLIAVDPSSPQDLGRAVASSIRNVIDNIESAPTLESEICQVIVRAASQWTLAQRLYLLNLMPNYSGPSTRLLSWTAYGMLIPEDVNSVSPDRYLNPPTLARILAHLFRSEDVSRGITSSSSLFEYRETETTIPNFEDLTIQIHILGHMLSDVRAFVEYDQQSRGSAAASSAAVKYGSPSKSRTHNATPLEMLDMGLSALHDGIFDIRASHLDRTRAKDAIQRLRMRIHYQRESALATISRRSGTSGRGKISAHFERKPTTPMRVAK